ncbi:MAG: AMP-binding protein [Novosphingobium sp.]|nr:AMP-binding protein [Novosphingobium sp.]
MGEAIRSYAETYAAFDAEAAERAILGDPGAVLNAAALCCDRHCGADRMALNAVSCDGSRRRYTFEELKDLSDRFAQVLRGNGVAAGDVVAALLPRIPELFVTALAVWRLGAIYQPLFTAFGPRAIEHRVKQSGARVIVADAGQRAKLDDVRHDAKVVTVVGEGAPVPQGDLDFHAEIAGRSPGLDPVARAPNDPFLIMFTSGTTGPSKGLLVPLRAIASFAGYMTLAVGLRPEDRYWNIADPGWAYGLYYAVIGPLALGHETLIYNGPFSVESTVSVIVDHGITILAGAPTAYRMLVAAGPDALAPVRGRLRVVSSAGEPLNPEVIRWFARHLDVAIHDHYGQTEMGMVLCNHHGLDHPVHLGAAGYSVPGFRVAVVSDGHEELAPGIPGNLAVELTRSPFFWFTGYLGRETERLGSRYYITGDSAELNEDGSISFVGRADDVITSAGYRIGPFDLESALVEHPAVVEAAVIGKPDPERTEIVKAFVVLQDGVAPSDKLAEELAAHVKARLSAHAYPREVEFAESLPKTPSGKIQRFILRNQEVAKAAANV